jgi:hypothetical protein
MKPINNIFQPTNFLRSGRANAPQPVVFTLEYVDLESPPEFRLPQGDRGMRVFHNAAMGKVKDAIETHMKSLDLPTLMERTKTRLDAQTQSLREKLAARYGSAVSDDSTTDFSPDANAKRLTGYALSLFDSPAMRTGQSEGKSERTTYADMIRSAISDGFAQARSVFEGLEKLDPKLAANVDATFAKVRANLAAFVGG